jgi:hypothetical protein
MKTAIVLLVTGILFFSCAITGNDDYGTLVITLPGGTSTTRAAISDTFAATLKYRIDCDGPGGSVSRQASPGDSASLSLDPGEWTVTVTALNTADQNIGSGTAPALIESGKVTTLQIPLKIDTSRHDITYFALTSPVSANGAINAAMGKIEVFVPSGTNITGMNFTVVHTGITISPAPGTPLDFSSPKNFTVTAENGLTKTYTVTVTVMPPSAGMGTWPTTWNTYGLSGLQQPAGTTVQAAVELADSLAVILDNATLAAFNNLVTQIETKTGSTGTLTPAMGVSFYDLQYTHGGVVYDLSLVLDMGGMMMTPGTLVLDIVW